MKLAKVHQEVEEYLQATKHVDTDVLEAKEEDLLGKLILGVQDQVIHCFQRDFGEEFLRASVIESLMDRRAQDYDEDLEILFEAFGVGLLDVVRFKNVIDKYLDEEADPELYKNFLQRRQEMYN